MSCDDIRNKIISGEIDVKVSYLASVLTSYRYNKDYLYDLSISLVDWFRACSYKKARKILIFHDIIVFYVDEIDKSYVDKIVNFSDKIIGISFSGFVGKDFIIFKGFEGSFFNDSENLNTELNYHEEFSCVNFCLTNDSIIKLNVIKSTPSTRHKLVYDSYYNETMMQPVEYEYYTVEGICDIEDNFYPIDKIDDAFELFIKQRECLDILKLDRDFVTQKYKDMFRHEYSLLWERLGAKRKRVIEKINAIFNESYLGRTKKEDLISVIEKLEVLPMPDFNIDLIENLSPSMAFNLKEPYRYDFSFVIRGILDRCLEPADLRLDEILEALDLFIGINNLLLDKRVLIIYTKDINSKINKNLRHILSEFDLIFLHSDNVLDGFDEVKKVYKMKPTMNYVRRCDAPIGGSHVSHIPMGVQTEIKYKNVKSNSGDNIGSFLAGALLGGLL